MRFNALRQAAIVAAMGVCGSAGLAQQAAPPPRLPPRWRTQLDLGLTDTRGNSRLTSLSVGEKLEFRPGRWLVTQTLSWVVGRNDSVETANHLKASLRGDYAIRPRLKVFGLAAFERNTFAGLSRRFEESVGLAWSALAGPRSQFDIEAGAGLNQQRAGRSETFAISRLASRFRHHFTAAAYVEQKAELLSSLDNLDDERVNAETALVAPLARTVSLRLSYQVAFDNVPVPGKKRTDTVFASGIQVVF